MTRPPTAVGGVVMALGIFVAGPLTRLPAPHDLVLACAAVVVLAWLGLAAALARSVLADGLGPRTARAIDSFGIATWIAGSAVMARVAMLAFPQAWWLARGAALVAAALWAGFMPLFLKNLGRVAAQPDVRPTGMVLLTTVAMQSVALLALWLLPAVSAARWVAAALMGLGAACYLVGACAILRHHAVTPGLRLSSDWHNSNCILHGALSITGLAAATSGLVPSGVMATFWLVVVAAFIAVELVEGARLAHRVRAFGWRRGVFTYDVSQWSRNFTFGMFYAFTLALPASLPLDPTFQALRQGVLDLGQYVVLALLLIEAVLLASALVPGLFLAEMDVK